MSGSALRRFVAIVLLLAAAAVAFWVWTRPSLSRADHLVTVRRATIATTVQATGRVQALRQAALSLPAGGEVLTVSVQVGDAVTTGDVLLALDTTEAGQRVREAEASLALRQIALDRARNGGSDDEIEAARARLQQEIVAREAAQAAYDKNAGEADAATSAEAVALARAKADEQAAKNAFRRAVHGAPPEEIASLEQQLNLAQISLERARRNLAGTQLVAPFAGTITALHVHAHERVNPTQPLATLADLSTLVIVAEVDETDIGDVAPGQEAEIRLDAAPGQVITGTVSNVAPTASSQRGATTFDAEIRFNSTGDRQLHPGMSAEVTIVTAQRESVLVVPRQALRQVGSKQLVTVQENGRRRDVEVITGVHNAQQVEVVSGLQEAEQVVVTGE